MKTGQTTNSTRKRTQRTHAPENGHIRDVSRLTCRQRKKQRAVTHARKLRLGTLSDCPTLSPRDKRRYNADISRVCQTPLGSTECQNRGEITFSSKYKRFTLHSEAEHKTYNVPTRAPLKSVGAYIPPIGIDTRWEQFVSKRDIGLPVESNVK